MIKKSELIKDTYKTGDIAKLLGVTNVTVHRLFRDNKIIYFTVPGSHHRRVNKKDLVTFLNDSGLLLDDMPNKRKRHDVVYARVSTYKQKSRGDLDRQINTVLAYAAHNNPVDIQTISDVASGLNDSRKGLIKLLDQVMNNEVDRVFINYKDRLTRFGYNYIKTICDFHNTEIVVVSQEENNKTSEEELA